MSKYQEEEAFLQYIQKEKKLSKLDKILVKLEVIETLLKNMKSK